MITGFKRMATGFPVCLGSIGFRCPGGFPPPLGQDLTLPEKLVMKRALPVQRSACHAVRP